MSELTTHTITVNITEDDMDTIEDVIEQRAFLTDEDHETLVRLWNQMFEKIEDSHG